jgi:predicted nucleotidyltransferase
MAPEREPERTAGKVRTRVRLSVVEQRKVVGASGFERLEGAAREVFASEPVVIAAWVYGSAARGEPAADLDVAVLLHGGVLGHARLEALAAKLQERGAPHGPEIDLRVLDGAAPRFRVTVLREGRRIFDRDPALRWSYEARFMSEWVDFRPTWERMRRRMLDRWTGG